MARAALDLDGGPSEKLLWLRSLEMNFVGAVRRSLNY